jgi:hypothetical protein
LLVLGTGGGRLVEDPGVFWHLQLGRDIAATGQVPRTDTLTWTRQGTPWVDQSWLFDLGLAWIVGRVGWSGAVALAAVILASVYAWLTHEIERSGRSKLAALVAAMIAAGVGSIHFHCRPHLATIAGVTATLAAVRSLHERNHRAVWFVPLLMIAWANLHGGFVAGLVILATSIAGELVSRKDDEHPRAKRTRVATLSAVLIGSGLAPLLNPYGVGLYRHVWGLLVGSRVTDLIQEYQPARLGSPEFVVLELALILLVALPTVSRLRASRYELCHILVWLHLGMSSVRNAPFFAIAVAPTLARYLDGSLTAAQAPAADQTTPSGRRIRWYALSAGSCFGLALAMAAGFPLGGPSERSWPLAGLTVLDREPPSARVFHDQDWGGLVESESSPKRKAFLDDRFELWGREAILEYVRALEGGPGWDELHRRYAFDLVWVRPKCGLAKRLAQDPAWERIHEDEVSVLWRYRGGAVGPAVAAPVDRGKNRGALTSQTMR